MDLVEKIRRKMGLPPQGINQSEVDQHADLLRTAELSEAYGLTEDTKNVRARAKYLKDLADKNRVEMELPPLE
jgi:hypothetical protein